MAIDVNILLFVVELILLYFLIEQFKKIKCFKKLMNLLTIYNY